MTDVDILIKPVSGLCNMRCDYCFYCEKRDNPHSHSQVMSDEVTQALVQKTFSVSTKSISFAFQGGEPTLAGLDFYRRFVTLVQKYQPGDVQVYYSIQTNGLTIDTAWCDFFREHNFLVGISIDGDQEIHDMLRKDRAGEGTYARAISAFFLLQNQGVDTNVLCVVTRYSTEQGEHVYQSLKNIGGRYIQFIPCLDPISQNRGWQSYSLSPEGYGRFLKSVFSVWYKDWAMGNYHSIRLFDDFVRILAGGTPATCASSGRCGRYLLVEADGTSYPCDFYAQEQWKLGNIVDDDFLSILNSPHALEFLSESSHRPERCGRCAYFSVCRGGCRRDWTDTRDNYYCKAFKAFFRECGENLQNIAQHEQQAMNTSLEGRMSEI